MFKFKFFYLFLIINLLLFTNGFIFSSNEIDINSIREKYFTDDKKTKLKSIFGLTSNQKRWSINSRGKEEYDAKGRKKKRGISNLSFFGNKKINNKENQEIKYNNQENFSKNYLAEDMEENIFMMTDDQYNEFIEELFKDF
jgi:hypothetical protein